MHPTEILQNVAAVVGGLALFLFGLHLTGEGLKTAFARHVRAGLKWVTRNRFLALAAGAVGTFFLSSSSAATALLVGLVEANLISAGQTYGVILGTGVGTAMTVQVIAFKVGLYAGILVAVGFLLHTASRYTRGKALGSALMGFGLLFVGLTMMGDGLRNMLDVSGGRQFVADLLANPLLTLLAAAGFTAIIQTSAATVVFAFTIAASVCAPGGQAAGNPQEAFVLTWPIVIGANIGTSATAVLASLGSGAEGWRVAGANVAFKIIAGAVLIFLGTPFAAAALAIAPGAREAMSAPAAGALSADQQHQLAAAAARVVANGHLLFNVAAAILLLPVLGWCDKGMNLLLRIAPKRGGRILERLDRRLLADDPQKALDAAFGQTLEMARRTRTLVEDAHRAIGKDDSRGIDDVRRGDDRLDLFYELLTDYLGRMPADKLDDDAAALRRRLILVADELEHVGDLLSKSLAVLARKKIEAGIHYDAESTKRLNEFVAEVRAGFATAVRFLAGDADAKPDGVLTFEARADERKRGLHLDYLRSAAAAALGPEAQAIYIEMISTWRSIHDAAAQIILILIGGPHGRRLGE